VDNALVGLGMTGGAVHIPAEGLEKGIEECPAQKLLLNFLQESPRLIKPFSENRTIPSGPRRLEQLCHLSLKSYDNVIPRRNHIFITIRIQ
jgi:hypothetical protein